MNTTQNSTKSKIVKVIGVDLAKDHCDVIGYDENGKICLRLDGCSYAKLREILSNLPQAVVLMEACKGSMFHARSIADLGHEVRLVKGADVKAGVSGFLCLGRLFQGQPNEAALCSAPRMGDLYRVKVPKAGCGHQASSRRQGCPS